MALRFQNLCSETVWIAFIYYDPTCGGGVPFRKQGWWQVDSGETFNAWNVDLRTVNSYAYFYASSATGTWSGTGNAWCYITQSGFNQCFTDLTNCNEQKDFVQLDFGGLSDVTVQLGPASGQLNIQGSVQVTCTVNQAGPAAQNQSETADPVIYLQLSDLGGSFDHTWFFMADSCKKEMLAVALAAISTQTQVVAWVVPPPSPPAPGGPSPECYNLYIAAS